jgi:hypothetical protein
MAPKWSLSLVVALLLFAAAPPLGWPVASSTTTEHPIPDPCERAPRLPFC